APLRRIGSTSIGSAESNTSHTASARRNNAAGVAAAKENVTFRPSPVRVAPATAAPSPAPAGGGGLVSACGSDAATVIFCGISTAAAGVSVAEGSGLGASEAGIILGAVSGLISMLASLADVSDIGGTISPDCRGAGTVAAGVSDAAGAAGA